jgi:hypothetical protein
MKSRDKSNKSKGTKKPKLKKIHFHSSFEEQRLFGQMRTIEMTVVERIREMYRINRELYGEGYGKLSKDIELFQALPGETVNDFYKRIENLKSNEI